MKASTRGYRTTISSQEWRWAAVRAVVGVILASLPYLIVFWITPPELVYTGFLTNPEDGHTYLAKMRQGQRGEWRYRLPYTAEPHEGEYIFAYYIALGQLARVLGLHTPGALIWLWHAARAVNGLILLLTLYYAIAHWFHDVALRRFAFTLTALGSGLGWLVALFGQTTVDLWVPEGYVWYSLFANPHFPLTIALMLLAILWSVTPWGNRRVRPRRLVRVGLCALALGLVLPLGLLNVGAALAAYSLFLWLQRRRPPWHEIASGGTIALTGGPFVLNAYLVTVRNPMMALWSAQNQTPSPPLWDYALGYGIVLLLAGVGILAALRRRRDSDWALVIWAATTGVLLYLPFDLQRRLVVAWIVPLGMLATRGWDALRHRVGRRALTLRRIVRGGMLWALVALTPIFLVSIAVAGAMAPHPLLFLARDEKVALDWLANDTNARASALVVAAPETGLYIPAWAGQRVWYGHRFETAHAEQRYAQLLAVYRDVDSSLLDQPPPLRAQYIWFGPREAALSEGHWQPDPDWRIAFQHGTVTLYALPQE
jgi:hypothetical protein